MNTNCEEVNVNGSLHTAAESIEQPTDSPEVKLYQVVVAANSRMSLNQDRPLLCMDDPTPAAEMTLEQREQEILEALKQDDWVEALAGLGYRYHKLGYHTFLSVVPEKVTDAYYDRHFQGTSVFNVDYGSPITLDDLEPADIAELKAKDAVTATPLELLDEAQLFDMDMDYKTPGLLGWVDRQARKRLVEIQEAIAAAERIKATQPNI